MCARVRGMLITNRVAHAATNEHARIWLSSTGSPLQSSEMSFSYHLYRYEQSPSSVSKRESLKHRFYG